MQVMVVSPFDKRVSLTCEKIQRDMRELADRLESGDESQLVCWIKRNELACTVRPLRRHPRYGGGRLTLPPEARPLVDDWLTFVKVESIRSVLSLMHAADLACYRLLGFRNENLLDHLTDAGFQVAPCPYEDLTTGNLRLTRSSLLSLRSENEH